jgi:hypothetical protein
MDIMNNMNVSSSKFTISMISLIALVIGGSAYLNQEAEAAVPTFIAVHNSTTTTEITFSEVVNGTAVLAQWKVNGVAVTAIVNQTGTAYGQHVNGYGGNAVNVFNRTTTIMLTHADIGQTDETTVQYVKPENHQAIRSSPTTVANDLYHNMTSQTINGLDHLEPTVVSAKMIDAKRIQITFSEPVINHNSTGSDFTLGGAPGVSIGSVQGPNGTSTDGGTANALIYLVTDKPISHLSKYLTIAYTATGGWDGVDEAIWPADKGAAGQYITDDTHSYGYGCVSACSVPKVTNGNDEGVGNRLATFAAISFDNIALSGVGDSEINQAPQVTASSVQVNNGFLEALVSTAPMNVDVEVGDTVTFDFTITDDNGVQGIPYVALYTNFIDRPDDMNLFYTNNFDSVSQESVSYYEWNVRSDDVAYDYSNTVSWNDAIFTIIDNNTMEISISMDITNVMNPSQVWLKVGDSQYNFNNLQLPITLDVTGDELLSFENTSNQKLLGFLNESVLSTIVSGWTNSSDDLANVVELSSALGVQDERLPSWTTNLASWVVNDDIYAADMIVAIEYLINQ